MVIYHVDQGVGDLLVQADHFLGDEAQAPDDVLVPHSLYLAVRVDCFWLVRVVVLATCVRWRALADP